MKSTSQGMGFIQPRSAPGTYGLIAAALGTYVISWLLLGKLLFPLSFYADWSHPWALVTYPFASGGYGNSLFWFLLELYWLYWVGTSAERDLGTPKYLTFFFASSAAAAIFIWLGLAIIHPGAKGLMLAGLELPIAALTVAWGSRHPHQTILLFAIVPIPGWILAWLTVALTLFGFGSNFAAPLMGVFACLHLGLAYLFATNKLPLVVYDTQARDNLRAAKATERREKGYYDDVKKREQDRAERERLRKLFESSMGDDKDK